MITAKQISALIESGNPCYLRRSFRRAVEAGAPQEHVHFLPRLPTHLLHVQVPLDLRAAAGSQEVLHRKRKKLRQVRWQSFMFFCHPSTRGQHLVSWRPSVNKIIIISLHHLRQLTVAQKVAIMVIMLHCAKWVGPLVRG